MKWFLGLVVVVLVSVVGAAHGEGREIAGGRYLGQEPPGFSPMVFAPNIISLSNRYEYCLTFSPTLDECVFGVTNSGWDVYNLWYTKMGSDSAWSDPVPAPFQGDGDGLNPFYSVDGNDIYFISSRPTHPPSKIWRSSREGTGWNDPVALDAPVTSGYNEWGGSLTADGTLYFCSERPGGFGHADIYRAITSPGGEVTVENLGAGLNSSQNDGDPCIAPDGSYLIFSSWRSGGLGQSDLHVSYNQDGVWTTPRNLGSAINTSWIEDWPSISPDGKYLFFNRRRAYVTGTQTEIWWVDARAVFHPEQSEVNEPGDSMREQTILHNEPNPFGPSTTITYSTPSTGSVAIKVFDALGREVRSLVNGPQAPGTHSVDFAAPCGERSADGVYFYSLQVGDRKLKTAKMVSLR